MTLLEPRSPLEAARSGVCPECGFSFDAFELADGLEVVAGARATASRIMAGAGDDAPRPSPDGWSPRQHVAHVAEELDGVADELLLAAPGAARRRAPAVEASPVPPGRRRLDPVVAISIAALVLRQAADGEPEDALHVERAVRWAAHEVVHHLRPATWDAV